MINFKFSLQFHRKYDITQYEELGFRYILLIWKISILPILITWLRHFSLTLSLKKYKVQSPSRSKPISVDILDLELQQLRDVRVYIQYWKWFHFVANQKRLHDRWLSTDEQDARYKGENETARLLRANLVDTVMEYTCTDGNTTCNATLPSDVDARARAININEKSGMDLVFVLDGSSSIKKDDFELGLKFVTRLVKMIGADRRP